MCYFLDENTDKGDYLELEVPEEISYDFMQKSDSPPPTPYSHLFGSSNPSTYATTPHEYPSPMGSPSKIRKFPASPEVRVIDPTPIHTPDQSPPRDKSGKSGISCPFSSPVGGIGGVSKLLEQQKLRKSSMDSNATETTGSMTTPTESDVSTEEFNYPSPPMIPPIKIQEAASADQTPSINMSSSSSNLIESVIQSLSKSKTIFPVKEDSQEDLYTLDIEHSLSRVVSAPMMGGDNEGGSMTLPRAKKRTGSVDHKTLRNARSLSCTSDESGGEDDTEKSRLSTQNVSPVRYVRPRSSSIKERVKFFESTDIERKTSGGSSGGFGPVAPAPVPGGGGGGPTDSPTFGGTRRRTGLATTSYLQSDLMENGPSADPSSFS
uniref:Uncharacterized protein n=1 Tax=Amphimedon queenslandica TaxID=400682 RepID=A0A1X7SRI8_AMPQE